MTDNLSISQDSIQRNNETPGQKPTDRSNPEAEQALLGALLIDPSQIPEIDLEPDEFYVHKHRWIYQAMVGLSQEGSTVDIITLTDRLNKLGKLKEVGGPAEIAYLINSTPSSLHAQEYAKIVHEDAMVRKLTATVTNTMAQVVSNRNGNLPDIIQEHIDSLQALLQGRLRYLEPWQVFTLADAYQVRPPVEYVASNLFAIPSLNITYGSPGTLKSFLLADLAVCVAAGVNWLPPAPWIEGNHAQGIATKRVPVMWLDFDNGRRRTHDRFGALGRARNLPADIPLYYYSMPYPWLDSSEKKSMGDLSLRIRDKGARLVIVDCLGVVNGDAEENSAEMGKVMSLWRQIAEDAGAAVVPIHHQRKATGMTGRAGDTLRGHSSIEAALDLALLIEREEYSDTIMIKATKVRGADVLPFSAAFTYEHDEHDELRTAKFYGVAAEDTQSGTAIEREIIVALFGTSLNKTDLVNTVKETLKGEGTKSPGVNRIRDMIDRLVKTGKLKVASGKNNTERIYSRP